MATYTPADADQLEADLTAYVSATGANLFVPDAIEVYYTGGANELPSGFLNWWVGQNQPEQAGTLFPSNYFAPDQAARLAASTMGRFWYDPSSPQLPGYYQGAGWYGSPAQVDQWTYTAPYYGTSWTPNAVPWTTPTGHTAYSPTAPGRVAGLSAASPYAGMNPQEAVRRRAMEFYESVDPEAEATFSFGDLLTTGTRNTQEHGLARLGLAPEDVTRLDETYARAISQYPQQMQRSIAQALGYPETADLTQVIQNLKYDPEAQQRAVDMGLFTPEQLEAFSLTEDTAAPGALLRSQSFITPQWGGSRRDLELGNAALLDDPQALYAYFESIGALDDPAVQNLFAAYGPAAQEAVQHTKDYWESMADRKKQEAMAVGLVQSLMMAPLGAGIGSALGGGMLGATAGGALSGAAKAAMFGGDPLKAALMGGIGGLAGGAFGGGGEIGGPGDLSFESMYDVVPGSGDIGYMADWMPSDTSGAGMLSVGGMSPAPGFEPFNFRTAAGLEPSAQGVPGVSMTPVPGTEGASAVDILRGAVGGAAPQFGFEAQFGGEGMEGTPEVGGFEADAARTMSPQQMLRTAQQAQKLYGLVRQFMGGREDGPSELPRRREGQSDADYWQDIAVDYLGLDVDTMAEAGLAPGSPEYMQYILEQADSIIAQIFGADPSALDEMETVEDLQAALRGKSEREMQQLMRALAVRGQLGQTTMAERAVDPFTGITEEFGGSLGGQGDIAAFQRGLARSVGDLAGMRGGQAREFLGGMLGRNADLYGLQAGMDARRLQEILASTAREDEMRRLGLSPQDDLLEAAPGAFWQDILEARNPAALERILGSLGEDTQRQGAAIERLFGWQ